MVTIGDEVLAGHTLDTNFHYLTRSLGRAGHRMVRHETVGDEADAIADAVGLCMGRADLVVVSGGLGGTPDDITLDAVAAALGRSVRESPEVLARLEAGYASRGQTMPPIARRIARVIEGSEVLENPVGQAPGVWLATDEAVVVLLPGIPAELRGITEGALTEKLRHHPPDHRILTVRTVGLGESVLAQALADRGVVEVAFLPASGMVDICLRVPREDPLPARAAAALEAVRELAGDAIIGDDTDTLEGVVGRALTERAETVACAESLTGGRLGSRIVNVPGASAYFLGSAVTYANALKVEWLGVARSTLDATGAVSPATAREMALGVRVRSGATWALSTTGIAGPTGATPGKPVGLVYMALAGPDDRTHVIGRHFMGSRRQVTDRTVVAALDLLRRALGGLPMPEEGP
jgi:nicotinamide-nucleotide amidase